jgi:hypothetical protein
VEIRPKNLILGICIAAAIAVLVTSVEWVHPSSAGRTAGQTTPMPALLGRTGISAPHSSQLTPTAARPAHPQSIRQRFRTAKDYFALAMELLPQAEAGNPEAQYVLFKAYNDCKSYAWEADNATLEAARDKALHLFPEHADQATTMAETGYQRCHGFFTDEAKSLGNPWVWLQQATDAGYPPAQATTANERLLQDHLKTFVKAGAVADGMTLMPPIGGDVNPRELLAAAVQSEDPDALATFGELQTMLHPTLSREVNNISNAAWAYIACQKGADCSFYGDSIPMNCLPSNIACPGVPQGLLDMVNGNWAPVQDKVNELTAALKAKEWGQLGLGTGG